jgi:hypothetical protein
LTEKKILAAEAKFRSAVIEYLREIGSLDDNNVLTHWCLLCTTIQLDDQTTSGVIYDFETGFPFWAQGGLLDYALTRHRSYISHKND